MLQVKLLNPDAKVPTRGTLGSAGYDLYSPISFTLETGLNKLKLGISVAIGEGYYGQIHDRSSMAVKEVTTSAGVIDSDYRGEVMILLNNHTDNKIAINKHDRVAQLILHSIITPDVEVTTELNSTNRTGGFGSTGQ
jgi:dUTP pyrophosphatase